MRCELIEPHLAAYLDGEVDEELHAAVEQHLRECAKCRETVRDMRLASAVLGKWKSAEPTQSLVEVLRRRIREEEASPGVESVERFEEPGRRQPAAAPKRRLARRRLAVAAVVLLALGLGFAVWDWMGVSWDRTSSRTITTLGKATMNARSVDDLRRGKIVLDGVIAHQWSAPRPAVDTLVQLEVVSTMMQTATEAAQSKDVGEILNILGEERLSMRVRRGAAEAALGTMDCFAALVAMKPAAAADPPAARQAHRAELVEGAEPEAAHKAPLYDEAVKLEERGELEAARDTYRKAAKNRLTALQSLIHEANIEMKLGRAEEALATLEAAYRLTRPKTFRREVVTELTRRAKKAIELQKKIKELEAELVKTEDAFDLLSRIGSLQVKAGDLQGAEKTLGRAIRTYTGPAYRKRCLRLRLVKAWCQREMNRFEPAFDEFNRLVREAAQADPAVAMLAQYERAKTHHLRGRYAQAIDDYTDLANHPLTTACCYAALEFQVGYIFLKELGNAAEAAKTFEKLSRDAYRNQPFGRLAAMFIGTARK